MKNLLLLLLPVVALLACGQSNTEKASDAPEAAAGSEAPASADAMLATDKVPTASIEGTYWVLTELMGKPVSSPDPEKDFYLQLNPDEKRVSAFAGCNSMTGGYELTDGNRITFTKMASTLKACPDMSVEDEFSRVLEMVDNYSIQGYSLSLNKAKMAPLARFAAKL